MLAAVLHVSCIGAGCMVGEHPLRSVFHATSLGALLTVVGYLLLSRHGKLWALGAIMGPIGLVGLVLAVVFGDHGVARPPSSVGLARAHVGLASLGIGGFLLAAGVAALYLIRERKLRNKVFRPGEWVVSLTALDRLHHRLVLLVTPVFTLAIVTGVLWMLAAGGPQLASGRIVEIAAAATAWLASVALLVSRAIWGTRGRRSAWLTLLALFAVVLLVIAYGVRA
jgi:ABC-type uncharacterized transport system permease subunit